MICKCVNVQCFRNVGSTNGKILDWKMEKYFGVLCNRPRYIFINSFAFFIHKICEVDSIVKNIQNGTDSEWNKICLRFFIHLFYIFWFRYFCLVFVLFFCFFNPHHLDLKHWSSATMILQSDIVFFYFVLLNFKKILLQKA